MTLTYKEHKAKYKRLKQAAWVLGERIKKAERVDVEDEIRLWQSRLDKENEEMDRIVLNKEQIEREYNVGEFL
jgi:hypothetical protein